MERRTVTEANPAARSFFGADALGGTAEVAREHLEPTIALGEWSLRGRRLSVAESALDSLR